MKRLLSVLIGMVIWAGGCAYAGKVKSTFWGCGFGTPSTAMEEALRKMDLNPIVGDGNIFLKNVDLDGISFQTVALIFSPVDGGLFKVIGSNRMESKEAADSCYNEALSHIREKYPNVQILRKPDKAERMCTYLDDENIFYLGLFSSKKDGKKVYFVNLNFWNKLMSKRITEQTE